MCKLTPKRQRFVDEYLIDLNGTQAAIRAGYSPQTANEQAAQLLANLSVQEVVAKSRAELSKKLKLTQERVLAEYERIAFSKLTDYVEWGGEAHDKVCDIDGEGGIKVVDNSTLIAKFTDSKQLTPDQAAAVSELSITKEGSVKLKLHDKKAALDSICKMLGFNAADKSAAGNEPNPNNFADALKTAANEAWSTDTQDEEEDSSV